MYGIVFNRIGKIGADGARSRFFRIGSAHQLAVFGHGIFTFQHLNHHRAAGHKSHQVAEKGAGFVHRVKILCFFGAQMFHFGCNNAQAVIFKTAVNLADNVFGYGIGFDNRNGAFNRHYGFP